MTVLKTHTRLQRIAGGLARGVLTLALVGLASCSVTHVSPRPLEAVLEIRVNGQWQMVKRERYVYETPMDEWKSLPVAELERMLRERESRGDFGPETTALRVLAEIKRAGMTPAKEK